MKQKYVEDAGLEDFYYWCRRNRKTHKCVNGIIYRVLEDGSLTYEDVI